MEARELVQKDVSKSVSLAQDSLSVPLFILCTFRLVSVTAYILEQTGEKQRGCVVCTLEKRMLRTASTTLRQFSCHSRTRLRLGQALDLKTTEELWQRNHSALSSAQQCYGSAAPDHATLLSGR